jgi:hypothetical protein
VLAGERLALLHSSGRRAFQRSDAADGYSGYGAAEVRGGAGRAAGAGYGLNATAG